MEDFMNLAIAIVMLITNLASGYQAIHNAKSETTQTKTEITNVQYQEVNGNNNIVKGN
jgi:hypothetical protein